MSEQEFKNSMYKRFETQDKKISNIDTKLDVHIGIAKNQEKNDEKSDSKVELSIQELSKKISNVISKDDLKEALKPLVKDVATIKDSYVSTTKLFIVTGGVCIIISTIFIVAGFIMNKTP